MRHRVSGSTSPRSAGCLGFRGDGGAILALLGMAVLLFWRLALTDLIIGRGDLYFYFYPYRDFASAAVRAGRVPLWNPYLFMGVPFIANSQAGFFYPLNLVLAWLPVERMVNASIVLHGALAAIGAYLWGRRGLGLGRPGAWLTGLCYGLGGYFVAQVEHLNQVQVLAWLPWLLWLYQWRAPKSGGAVQAERGGLRFAGLALVIALQFLAGHTQSVFICLLGLTSYAVLPAVWDVVRRETGWRELARMLGIVVGVALWGGALAAVQLLPTLELTGLSIRSGGLPLKEAVSFSLRPGLVGRALLPSWGPPLFPEFVAHVGVVSLGMAIVGVSGVWRAVRSSSTSPEGGTRRPWSGETIHLARLGALLLTILGLFLALGGYNPVYLLLVKLVPGFGLFRAPARWLVLYALGVSALAGIGLESIVGVPQRKADEYGGRWLVQSRSVWMWGIIGVGILAGLVLLGQLLGGNLEPDLAPPLGFRSVAGWLVAALALSVGLSLGLARHEPRYLQVSGAFLIGLAVAELLGASVFLPINRATAPGALTSLRPAVAHLLAEANEVEPGPPARFLSISDVFFDPGDKPEIEIALGPQLSDDALYDYIVATKQKEVLIPNLPLYYRLHSMDGYDGGVLPLSRYVTLERLYMPEERVAIDGRLRENLDVVPDGRWLNLFNVRFVVTDKVGDVWSEGVFYDLQMDARLPSGSKAHVGDVPALASTALGIVYRAQGAFEGTLLADLDVTMVDGQQVRLPLLAERAHQALLVNGVDTGDRVAQLTWGAVSTPLSITVRGAWDGGQVLIRGLSLVDERTDVFQPLLLSSSAHYRLAHSGDVKIYENLDVFPRAFFVPRAEIVPDDKAALAAMREPDFDPMTTIVLADKTTVDPGSRSWNLGSIPTGHAQAEIVVYEPEHVVVTVNAPADGWLLLSDAWYPGWEARVDGASVPVERADILFRAVAVPAGEHRVEWVYRPMSFRLGVAISLCAFGLLLAGGVWRLAVHRSPRRNPLS